MDLAFSHHLRRQTQMNSAANARLHSWSFSFCVHSASDPLFPRLHRDCFVLSGVNRISITSRITIRTECPLRWVRKLRLLYKFRSVIADSTSYNLTSMPHVRRHSTCAARALTPFIFTLWQRHLSHSTCLVLQLFQLHMVLLVLHPLLERLLSTERWRVLQL